MSARAEVAVTGLGLVTPAGTDEDTVWSTMNAGRSLATTDPELEGLAVDFSCRVQDFAPAGELGRRLARRLDRFQQMGLVAARRALRDAGLAPLSGRFTERVGVVLGVGSNSLETYVAEFGHLGGGRAARVSPLALPRSIPSMAAGEVAIDTGARGPNFTVSSACASGATALGVARDMLLAGRCDVVLAGGSESARSRMTATCFAQLRALSSRTGEPHLASRPFDTERDGFVLGEGAAVLVLEKAAHARGRRARIRSLLRGYGASADAHHPVAPAPEGAQAEAAMRAALADAECAPGDIGHVNAHGTSTPVGDVAEAQALHRLYGGSPPPVAAAKSVLGHSLGAAGAIEAALTVLALERQEIPPQANLQQQEAGWELDFARDRPRRVSFDAALSSSFGFGGQNAALVLAAG